MLSKLSITNYALIQKLQVDFHANLNTVTGETGAGKSIILGALGLILGNRADLSVLKDKAEKCIVEGHFSVENYSFDSFFEANDLDYDPHTILRREITPAGKSRAFINDTPVNLKVLRELGLRLIDIHSQHQNLELGNQKFQLGLVDAVGNCSSLLEKYRKQYTAFKKTEKELRELKEQAEKSKTDLDYFQFQFNQLEEAALQENEQSELEAELEQLNHAEEIKGALTEVGALLDNEQFSVIGSVKESLRNVDRIKEFMQEANPLSERLESIGFELRDIVDEAESLAESVEFNPARIEQVNDRLNLLYSLQQKHNVATMKELIDLRDDFDAKISTVVGYDEAIHEKETALAAQLEQVKVKAEKLTKARQKAFPVIEKSVVNDLQHMGMDKATFSVQHSTSDEFLPDGQDSVLFVFSANADSVPDDIAKIASGGEMSRLMLAIKNLMRNSKALPTVVFDEIDTGVSGVIAVKMGNIIKSFSSTTQIINITHLPQIAAKGDEHFKVYKAEKNGSTLTSIKALSHDERIEELAKMVGGEKLTNTTLEAARELLEITE